MPIRRDRSNTSSSLESNQSIEKKIAEPSSPSRPRASSGLSLLTNDQDYFDGLLAAVDAAKHSSLSWNVLASVAAPEKNLLENIDFSRQFSDMRQSVMTAVNELNDELDAIYGPISELAQDHIHADETILTYGHSMMVEFFLKAAARKRKYQVIIVEASSTFDGHLLANNLAKIPNISVTLIPDSNIYAIMSRVNKVIISPQAVMADGGAIGRSGYSLVTMAAKDFSVPVLGIISMFSLTPLFAHNQSEVLGTLFSPASTVPYHTMMKEENVQFMIPAFDYIAPEYIDLYLTNNGCHLPSYIYRILPEYYHPADYDL
jgi:translation initiation factor eIF-2B subunit beta